MRAMFIRIILAILFSLAPLNSYAKGKATISAEKKSGEVEIFTELIDDFESLKSDKFPGSWRTWPFQRDKAKKVYKVRQESDGNKYLEAFDDKNVSVQLLKNFFWKINDFPHLSWKWRAKILPDGAKENDSSKNDSACGLYVTIGYLSGHAMKYVWSSTLPTGTVITRKEGRLKMLVLNSGRKKLGEWQSHKVNVLKDYQKLFGKKLKKTPRLGILTDGNAVKKTAACDYDDFFMSSH